MLLHTIHCYYTIIFKKTSIYSVLNIVLILCNSNVIIYDIKAVETETRDKVDKQRKIRDVIYGFVYLDEQECEIIDHPAFQRLRRIKQLSLTDMVYPGASHTRFEHSIGVMQMVSDMYDSIVSKRAGLLKGKLSLDEFGVKRYRKIVRLAALLHDVGHAPFSHAGEDLMPLLPESHPRYDENSEKRYNHEDYSIKIIKAVFADLIENHKVNNNYNINVEDITALLGDFSIKTNVIHLLWKDLISGQIDADRADYLLRDSRHLGVNYGIYDKDRLVSCMTVCENEAESVVVAIEGGGWNIAESLVIARYQMFSQVYFHKVRRIYDYHISCATKEILGRMGENSGYYPSPENFDKYLKFDDWTIYTALKEGLGGKHGGIILNRQHYKCKYQTHLSFGEDSDAVFKELKEKYKDKDYFIDDNLSTSWYKTDKDIYICQNDRIGKLSGLSNIVRSMNVKSNLQRFYVEES